MKKSAVVRETVDGMGVIALLTGSKVTVFTDLTGPMTEVGNGRWDGARFECSAWLGRDLAHGDMVHAAVEAGFAAYEAGEARERARLLEGTPVIAAESPTSPGLGRYGGA